MVTRWAVMILVDEDATAFCCGRPRCGTVTRVAVWITAASVSERELTLDALEECGLDGGVVLGVDAADRLAVDPRLEEPDPCELSEAEEAVLSRRFDDDDGSC